jgi:energy-coupling factor transporter ATP-binding protein EcfA2
LIEIENLSFSYEGKEVLKNINLKILKNEKVVIGGHNGSGKTTLIKHFNGLNTSNNGTVKVFGKETKDYASKDLVKKVGLVFQNPDHQIFESSVKNEIEFGPKKLGLKCDTQRILEQFGLNGLEQRHPSLLSRGQRKRLAIASVYAGNPDILVLDEPFIGQDKESREKIGQILRNLNKTVIFVSHDPCEFEGIASRAIVLKNGSIIYDGGTEQCIRSLKEIL